MTSEQMTFAGKPAQAAAFRMSRIPAGLRSPFA